MEGKKHVTTACLHCRRRKIKCDGQSTCSNCAMLSQKCLYNAEDDNRRTSAKRASNALKNRLVQLEEALKANNIELPPPPAPTTTRNHENQENSQDNARRSSVRETTEETQHQQSSSFSQAASNPPDEVQFSSDWASNVTQDNDEVLRERSINESSLIPSDAFAGTSMPASDLEAISLNYFQSGSSFDALTAEPRNASPDLTLPLNADSPPSPRLTSYIPDTGEFRGGTASRDNITNSLAARMGSLQIAEDGQLRYYGPTSNLHLYHNGLQSLSRSTIQHVAIEGNEVLRRAGLDQKIPLAVEMHLAHLYFSWEDPAIHVVDEEIFFLEKQKWIAGNKNTPYYSETLNNAICAIGANLAAGERLDVPEPAPEFFSSRAKALLDIEMDSPNVATVQALVIMSASEAAFTRDARGWLYSGMAVRLSADLGLHLDLNDQYRSGMLSQRDMDVRRTTFWGVFIHDNMWSLYVGRPWGISIRDISVSRPLKELDAVRRKLWKPYPINNGQSTVPPEGLLDPLEACTDANITLCGFMRRINRTLYSGRKIGIDELAKFLSTTQKELSLWMDNLSPELRVDLSNTDRTYIPHVLQLHMQFYAAIIFLFRPYFSHHLLRATQSLNTMEDRAAVARVKSDCISAAHSMVEVLRCFRKQHSLRHTNIQIVHLIFTASLIHIYNACTCTGADSQTALDDLQFCCQSLGEIGQTYC
ncbi:uncharacterized protein K444DRAFT_598015 [Hyaloscypha bicolor E]|uniref:Zn(2)-C6 fungal-type domain-containing protein n=1 Tax=Hyaloscypha bicolor E TaxID=1095630 RepID=A0A2J6SUG5_9HELO|nr:uncharacterized protein K444DRAFT_598015 [Hyaloscypha bicolor E]PMD54418.1 hypothetical protein K444DRAFT_598015 [Hyaloscypha bicolor E]